MISLYLPLPYLKKSRGMSLYSSGKSAWSEVMKAVRWLQIRAMSNE